MPFISSRSSVSNRFTSVFLDPTPLAMVGSIVLSNKDFAFISSFSLSFNSFSSSFIFSLVAVNSSLVNFLEVSDSRRDLISGLNGLRNWSISVTVLFLSKIKLINCSLALLNISSVEVQFLSHSLFFQSNLFNCHL